MAAIGSGVGVVVGGTVVIAAYLLPTIIAGVRRVVNIGSVFAINLLLGWTFVGWVVALAWHCAPTRRTRIRSGGGPKPRHRPLAGTPTPRVQGARCGGTASSGTTLPHHSPEAANGGRGAPARSTGDVWATTGIPQRNQGAPTAGSTRVQGTGCCSAGSSAFSMSCPTTGSNARVACSL